MVLAQEEAARSLQERQVHIPQNTQDHDRAILFKPQDHIYSTFASKRINIQIKTNSFIYWDSSSLTLCCHGAVSHPFFTSLLSSGLPPLSQFFYLCLSFSLVFSLLHTASQKHSLKPMHESNLAHIKWSKVWAQYVWPHSVSDSAYMGWIQQFMQSRTTALPWKCLWSLVLFGAFEFDCCWTACLCKVLLMFPAHVKVNVHFVYLLFAYKTCFDSSYIK